LTPAEKAKGIEKLLRIICEQLFRRVASLRLSSFHHREIAGDLFLLALSRRTYSMLV
jgi:hypothetical protein